MNLYYLLPIIAVLLCACVALRINPLRFLVDFVASLIAMMAIRTMSLAELQELASRSDPIYDAEWSALAKRRSDRPHHLNY